MQKQTVTKVQFPMDLSPYNKQNFPQIWPKYAISSGTMRLNIKVSIWHVIWCKLVLIWLIFSWIYKQKWNIFFKWSRWLIKITYMFQSTMWILFTSAFLYFTCWKIHIFVAYQFCLALPATAYSWNCSWSKFNWVRVAELGLAAELCPA